jgi:hypothetical protein
MHAAMPESQIQRPFVLTLAVLIPEEKKEDERFERERNPSMLTIAK